MKTISTLFEKNAAWSQAKNSTDPDFFKCLAEQQSPKYLWIGCADSRVPPSEIMGLDPGEVFVHRNIANLIHHSDLSMLSVVQYAVEHLKVQHIILCGHYGCGGVAASVDGQRHGIVDNWIKPIAEVAKNHEDELAELAERERLARLCELNVLAQTRKLSETTVLQDAWTEGNQIDIHPWIYSLCDGKLKDLGEPLTG